MESKSAMATCENVLSVLKNSGLNFIIQETPFSAYLTIRKKFCKDFKNNNTVVEDIQNEQIKKQVTKLENENGYLKNELEKTLIKVDTVVNENQVLQQRLKNAEKDMLKHFTDSKLSEARLAQEISGLKQTNKKSKEHISELSAEISKEEKKVKALEKTITKLEAKIRSVTEQLETCRSDKNNNKKEYEKLIKEVKILKDKVPKTQALKSISTQTDTMKPLPTTESSPARNSSEKHEYVKCLVCGETFKSAEDFKDHSKNEHDILIDVQILENSVDEDEFTRILKSMVVDSQYLQERIHYYPAHWDHIDLRIKIRMIAKMKYEGISRQIDRSMIYTSSMKTNQRVSSNEI